MHYQWLILLVSTALLANTDAVLKATVLPLNSLHRHNVPTSRLLRAHQLKSNGQNAEERGVGTSAVETLTNSLKVPASQQLDAWLTNGKSADDVFKLLTLDKAADGLLANPQLNDWISYMNLFNEANPAKRTTVIATLTRHFGDEGLARIIEAAKQAPTTAALAKRMQTEQIQRWLVDKKTPEDVFSLLKLDDVELRLFEQPQIVTWAKYLDDFKKANPTSETTLLLFLNSRYDDSDLVSMLIAAKNVPQTEKLAIRIQAEMTALWLKETVEPADVFTMLKLDEIGYSILGNPLFAAWVKYTDDFREIHYGTKLTTISVLRQYYSDFVLTNMLLMAVRSPTTSAVSRQLLQEQVRSWYFARLDPAEVFTLLKIGEAKTPLLENPLYYIWHNFASYYKSLRPKEDMTPIAVLRQRYNEDDLLTTLLKAWEVPHTKIMAEQLLKAQLERWLKAQTDPKSVFSLLRVENTAEDDIRRLLYEDYLSDFKRLSKRRKTSPK